LACFMLEYVKNIRVVTMKKKFGCLFLFLIVLSSCAEEQNFNQFDDLNLIPTVATSLLFFESPENTINQLPAGNFYNETFTFVAFSEAFIADRVVDGSIIYELENTTSKEINVLIEFIDASNTVLDSESFLIQSEPAPFLERQVAYGNGDKSLDILRNTVQIRITAINLGDNISESTVSQPKIILKSNAVFRVRLQ